MLHTEIGRKMFQQALTKFSHIYPCADKTAFSDCFTRVRNHYLFWFNTDDKSTHVIKAEIALG